MVRLFAGIGLDAKKARETTTNARLSTVLKDVIFKAGAQGGCDKAFGQLLYQAATQVAGDLAAHQDILVSAIKKKEITSVLQLEGTPCCPRNETLIFTSVPSSRL